MNVNQAAADKWKNYPKTYAGAKAALSESGGCACVVCGRKHLVLPITRPPSDNWRVHCNHCGSEVPLAVVMNLKAWRVLASYHNRHNERLCREQGGKDSQ